MTEKSKVYNNVSLPNYYHDLNEEENNENVRVPFFESQNHQICKR